MNDLLSIKTVIDDWVVCRDSGIWDRFSQLWHEDSWMAATWYQGTGKEFTEMSINGFEAGVSIFHFQGPSMINISKNRAIAQTKMIINQRGVIDDVEVDVSCSGRFYDFFEKKEINNEVEWRIARRQPIYEKDWMSIVNINEKLEIDNLLLKKFPYGYRNLAYLQSKLGYPVKDDMPELRGAKVEILYKKGEQWIAGEIDEIGSKIGGNFLLG